MNDSTINTRYAKALFKLAKEQNIVNQMLEDMINVFETFDKVVELKILLEDPVVATSKKINVVQAVFQKKISDTSLSFVTLIVSNKREFYIKGIARYFLDLVKRDKGIKTVVLTTANKINQKQKETIIKLIKKEIESEIELTEVVNDDIIGGFILRIDDSQFDSSVKTELNNMRKQLLETSIEN